jgi:Holliday junction resolvasome RuvABC endonuclease subunit
MKPVVIAFDPATICGCAVGPVGGKPSLFSTKLKGKTVIHVFGHAASLVHDLIDLHNPSLIAVEEPFYMSGKSNYHTTVLLHGLFGAIGGAAASRNIKVLPVTVASWRKQAMGTAKFDGRRVAKQAMLKLCGQLGWTAPDDNAADAAGIWIWATSIFAPYGVVR